MAVQLTSTSGRSALAVAQEVALKAGETLVERFSEDFVISAKGRGDIVTDVDKEVETQMLATLRREYPDVAVLGEESAAAGKDGSPGGQGSTDVESGYLWVVDPLDGTRNYAWGIPFFSLVVGLVLDGEPIVGINYDPQRGEMFYAERGQGAFLNGEPIHVSDKARLEDGFLGMDLSYNDEGAVNGLNVILSLWPGIRTARVMGSSALGITYAAAGRTDLYFHHRLEPWDQVAGILLVEEAGGVITDRSGMPAGLYSDGLIASNATLHAEFMRKTEGTAWRKPTHRQV